MVSPNQLFACLNKIDSARPITIRD